jgi:2-oxoglutarate dehydrogenase E1 component
MSKPSFSYASLANLPLIERLYASYLADPQSVDPSWRLFFEGVEFAAGLSRREGVKEESPDLRVYLMIQAYRTFGHLLARFNPIEVRPVEETSALSLETLGFKPEECARLFPTCGFLPTPQAPLQEIIEALKQTYCGSIGVEYMGLGEPELEAWLQKRIEPRFDLRLSAEEKLRALHMLNRAEIFESFLHTKYVGQKRFSLEGGETLIPMLAAMAEAGAVQGVKEIVLGMSHRGRLNVLANILNKSYALIFHEFEDHYSPELLEGTGDVKYHKGFCGSFAALQGEEVAVTLCANPSHLESVDPVVEGQVRALQERAGWKEGRRTAVPLLIHGDAAVAGQGVVYETMQLRGLNGYGTGGTVHIVINNQIGFTTLPKDARSTRYCTDLAKSFGAPVLHVNAEDPEGCLAAAKIAMEMRQTFHCDVFIDLNCYRKHGHNESDEPLFTQPLEYQLIKKKTSIRAVYRERLIQEGVLSREQADALEQTFRSDLQKALDSVKKKEHLPPKPTPPQAYSFQPAATAVAQEKLIALSEKFCAVPEGFHIHPKIARLLKERLEAVKGGAAQAAIDWGMGEYLAYASLLDQGIHVRLSGQDARRGTFTHRHAVWVDQVDEKRYFPLSKLQEKQALFDVYNSPLSEFAVLGFEFGYSLSYPEALVIWEAQFGDFSNGAQIVIDQYITASEQKWGYRSNLVLLLPHGYEGQGPEHSSARLERFLQLSADENIQVVNCTTPAQFFHVLRRQVLRAVRKPLVIFSPKALLRLPQCVSPLSAFASGSFEEILDDPEPPQKRERLLLCSGKIYYDLVQERSLRGAQDAVAIVRIEQLYPLDLDRLQRLLSRYSAVKTLFWVQEEHSNMGAWDYIRPVLEQLAPGRVRYAGRTRSASPAAGSYALHKQQHAALMDAAFNP